MRASSSRELCRETALGAGWGWGGSARLRRQEFHSWDPTQFLRSVCIGEMFERRNGGKKKAHHYLDISSPARRHYLPALLGARAMRSVPSPLPAPLPAGTATHSPLLPLPSFIPSPAAALGGSGRPLLSTPRIDRTPERKPTGQTSLGESPHLQRGRKGLPHRPLRGETSPGSARPRRGASAREVGEGRRRQAAPPPPPGPALPAGSPRPAPSLPRAGGAARSRPGSARPAGPLSPPRPPAPRAPPGPRSRHFRPGGRMRPRSGGRAGGPRAPLGTWRREGRTGSPRRGGESCQKRRKRGGESGAAPRPFRPPPAAAAPGAPRRGSLIDPNVGKSSGTNLMACPLQPPSLTS